MEMAAKDAIELQGKSKEASIHLVERGRKINYPDSSRQKRQQNLNCFRCGDSGHSPNNCKFKNMDCYVCGKNGHIKQVCLSKHKANGKFQSRNNKEVRNIENDEKSSEEDISDEGDEVTVRYKFTGTR